MTSFAPLLKLLRARRAPVHLALNDVRFRLNVINELHEVSAHFVLHLALVLVVIGGGVVCRLEVKRCGEFTARWS